VRFAAECLAFANVPETASLDELLKDGQSPTTHPAWKARVPRDGGASWDFDDVRDHYTRVLFGVDPAAVRYADVERYLALARVTTGEVMERAFAEWRRHGSVCRGALIWFFRDLWLGAGWGVVDAAGRPKAPYYYLKRALRPVAVFFSDEGLNGLALHAINESSRSVEAELRVTLYRHGEVSVAVGATGVTLSPRSATSLRAATLFEGFLDTTYAYRFGPPGHDVAVVALIERGSDARLSDAFYFPLGLPSAQEGATIGLEASAQPEGDGIWRLAVRTKRFAQSVAIDAPGFAPDDNYFHVEPGGERLVILRAAAAAKPPRGTVRALNAHVAAKITTP
jgi:beta-mannosidase